MKTKQKVFDVNAEQQTGSYLYKFVSYPIGLFLYLVGFCWAVLYVCPPVNMMLYEGLVGSESDYMLVMPVVCAINCIMVAGTLLLIHQIVKWVNNACKKRITFDVNLHLFDKKMA